MRCNRLNQTGFNWVDKTRVVFILDVVFEIYESESSQSLSEALLGLTAW